MKHGRHAVETPFVKQIEQGGVEDVVHVVTEGYLVEAVLLSEVEDGLPSLPRAEEAGCVATVGRCVERGGKYVEWDAETLGELAELLDAAFVFNVLHSHVNGFCSESWNEDALTVCYHLGKA